MLGKVKWFNSDKGYGFLCPDDGGDDVFVHYSEIMLDGFKGFEEDELVSFDIQLGQNGKLQATGVQKISQSEYDRLRKDEQVENQLSDQEEIVEEIGIALIDGKLRLVAFSSDGRQILFSNLEDLQTIAILDMNRLAMLEAIDELEFLMNASAKESAFQDFFERYPDFIMEKNHVGVIPQVSLFCDSGKTLRPDFILKPVNQQHFAEIVELKLPSSRLVVGPNGRERLSASVSAACAQLREYSNFFNISNQRDKFEKQYPGLRIFKPTMWLVIGRKGTVDPYSYQRLKSECPVRIRTYDELLERYKALLL
jgi:CspA family cold shock protein